MDAGSILHIFSLGHLGLSSAMGLPFRQSLPNLSGSFLLLLLFAFENPLIFTTVFSQTIFFPPSSHTNNCDYMGPGGHVVCLL